MKAKVFPGKASGSVHIPSSKSMAHRAIICASLAKGTSIITNIDYSADIEATIEAMRKLNVKIIKHAHSLVIEGNDVFKLTDSLIDCNESGSTLRFLIPLFTLTKQKICFLGKGRLFQRPLDVYTKIFDDQKISYSLNNTGLEIMGSLKANHFELAGNISSQFISGLLFALPLLEEDSIIQVNEPFESKSYVAMTLQMLHMFQVMVDVKKQDHCTMYYIKGRQKFQATNIQVEGDYSQCAFFATLGAINGTLEVNGMSTNSLQGDKQILSILKEAGIEIEAIDHGYRITKGNYTNKTIDLSNCPDLGPILMVLGAFGSGKMTMKHCQRLRLKESDRIDAMEQCLKKLGVWMNTTDDQVEIIGQPRYQGGIEIDGFNDHRIVMSMAIMATCLDNPITIHGAEAIKKSYPHFFDDLKSLNIQVDIDE